MQQQEPRTREDLIVPAGPVRERSLPILTNGAGAGRSKASKWRALTLLLLTIAMAAHFIQWRMYGSTVSPIEPSETMYTLASGAVNAGFIFFTLAILSTLIAGRWVCGWGCHVVGLQDACAWLLLKLGLKPRPFRSRLLMFVPAIAAAYMFLWPVALRVLARPKGEPLIPQFTNHLITTEFWATFPTIAVAVPFLFICGFLTVYFLGSKGFCTYGCPYGGVFRIADKFAPLRIRVTDACTQCGDCTATCMANVKVHIEVKEHAMVVDPGCMKHMDCVSVCPNDALYLGFGKAPLTVKSASSHGGSMSWGEEFLAATVFVAAFFSVWDVYQLVPMLMALGIAPITTFLVMRSIRLLRSEDLTFYKWVLKSQGKIYIAGWIFVFVAGLWTLLNIHSGYIHYHEVMGLRAFQALAVPDELALAQADPGGWLSESDKHNLETGKRDLYRAFDGGFFVNTVNLQSLGWMEYLSGNPAQATRLLALASSRQTESSRALSDYYRGAILNRTGRWEEATSALTAALDERPDLVKAVEETGVSKWHLGQTDAAIADWKTAASQNAVLACYMLSGALAADPATSATYGQKAESLTPDDPYFHWMVGLRLQDLKMNDLAEKHFQRAVELDSKFILRRRPR